MLKNYKIIIILGMGILSACAMPEMPSIRYDKPISFKTNKNAILSFETERYHAGRSTVHTAQAPAGSGLIGFAGVMLGSTIKSIYKENHDTDSGLSFGKKEQEKFMLALQEVLLRNQTFKKVEFLNTPTKQSASNHVLINVNFKNSRVASERNNNRITLTVEMDIQSPGRRPFSRRYLVQNQEQNVFNLQQRDVSERLMEKLISGITAWHRNEH